MKSAFVAAAMLAVAIPALAPAAATAAIIENTAGDRGATISFFDPLGQSFTAIDSRLTSIGFQFESLNPTAANDPLTLTLRAGEGLTGAVLATVTATLPASINDRTPVFYDFALGNTAVTIGGKYTAVLTTSSSARNAVAFGPRSTNTAQPLGPDAYLGGRAFFTGDPDPYGFCTSSGQCDLNFRVIGATPAGAVPEPASWAMLIGGFALTGGALRRRRATRAFA